jgi:hypothetical protein
MNFYRATPYACPAYNSILIKNIPGIARSFLRGLIPLRAKFQRVVRHTSKKPQSSFRGDQGC